MPEDYPVAVPQPDISRARFTSLLATAGSPAAPDGWVMWEAAARKGVSPLFLLGMFMHESRFGLAGVANEFQTHSPGNVRSVQNPEHGGVVIQTNRGPFVKYVSWELGTLDWADRLLGEKYAGSGLTTVREVIPKWAPADDGNQPVAYIASVLGFISRHQEQIDVPTMPPLINAILPQGSVNRPGQRITMRFFTVHETANEAIGASARMHRNYVHSGGGPGLTSYTYVTDHLEAYNLIPVGESSNHAGTAQGNLSGYSMELCVNFPVGSPEWRKTQDNGLALIAHAYATTPTLLPVEESLVPHRHWRSTECPARLTGAAWEAFRALAIALVNGQPPSTDPLLDAEYARLGGVAALGEKRMKVAIACKLDWIEFNGDALLCQRNAVATDPNATVLVQRLLTGYAADELEKAGSLRPYKGE